MKTIYRIPTWFAIWVLLCFSCTDKFDEYNMTGMGLITEEIKSIDNNQLLVYFPNMFYHYKSEAYWLYQRSDFLNADCFGGYLASNNDYGQNNNLTGKMNDEWNSYRWNPANEHCMKNWWEIKKRYKESTKHIYAAALIWKVLWMQRVVDAYGPIPYSKYGQGGFSVEYDSEEQIYTRFIAELDTARNELTDFTTKFASARPISSVDKVFDGDYAKWIQLANTLQLRIALRAVKVKPNWAKQVAEKVLVDNNFLQEDVVYKNSIANHPLIGLAYDFGELQMSANMESYLVGYKDPRLPVIFTSSSVADNDEFKNSNKFKIREPLAQWVNKFVGVRVGIASNGIATTTRSRASSLNGKYLVQNLKLTPVEILNAAEVYFNKAEAALRGWNAGGTSQSFYEEGVRFSISQWEAGAADTYLSSSTTPSDHKDLYDANLDIPAMSSNTVKWEVGATQEEKLEKIITQKWIANFPNGTEAWAEYRRTGYPKLFPIQLNQSDGLVNSNLGVRRLTYPQNEVLNNAEAVDKAIKMLKSRTNSPGSRIWWDVAQGNF